jgi:predicted XRE-type DNA-binding protein
MVAAGLSAVGITEERVSKLVGGDCGCSKRKQLLNQLGRKIGIGQEG